MIVYCKKPPKKRGEKVEHWKGKGTRRKVCCWGRVTGIRPIRRWDGGDGFIVRYKDANTGVIEAVMWDGTYRRVVELPDEKPERPSAGQR